VARSIAKQWGFDYFLIMRFPGADDRLLSKLSIVSNWPPELISTYDQLGLLQHSPIIGRLRKSTRPLVFSIEDLNRHRADGRDMEVCELFQSFGLCNGMYFSTIDPSGRRGAVSFSGTRPVPSEKELIELSYIANIVYDRISAIGAPEQSSESVLSAREMECLVWTSGGKTSAEIASILELSEHTVNHYLSSACQKLGAMNRAHAVAKAIRSGLLD
jgi:LuxR family quorum sensing-dependent transcriptional regulator